MSSITRMFGRLTVAAAMLAGLAVTEAQAMPVAPVATLAQGDGAQQPDGSLQLTGGGCGPAFHRDLLGFCKRNLYGPGGYYGPPLGFYGRPRYYGGPRYYGRPRYYARRCFWRETYYGPRRICR